MLIQEARWLAGELGALDPLSPLLDVGSGSLHFRTVTQPWIEETVFGPLRERGHRIHHLDTYPGPGIDLVGDVGDRRFAASLDRLGIRTVLCSNVLEHVPDPAALARAIAAIPPVGGHLVVSVPHTMPYHPDPIDTMFRPGVADLAGLFPGTALVAGSVVAGSRLVSTYAARARRRLGFWRDLPREGAGGGGVEGRRPLLETLRWLPRTLRATCVVLRKER